MRPERAWRMGKLALSQSQRYRPPRPPRPPKATRNRMRGRKSCAWSGDWLRGVAAGACGQGIAVTLSIVAVQSVPLTWLVTGSPI